MIILPHTTKARQLLGGVLPQESEARNLMNYYTDYFASHVHSAPQLASHYVQGDVLSQGVLFASSHREQKPESTFATTS